MRNNPEMEKRSLPVATGMAGEAPYNLNAGRSPRLLSHDSHSKKLCKWHMKYGDFYFLLSRLTQCIWVRVQSAVDQVMYGAVSALGMMLRFAISMPEMLESVKLRCLFE